MIGGDPMDEIEAFPDPELADENGLLCYGGDFHPARLLAAYRQGIFPWDIVEGHILWYCPDPRLVLRPTEFRASRSLRALRRRGECTWTFDRAFGEVVAACAAQRGPDRQSTWIHPAYIEGFTHLHREGFAHSVEVWSEGALVGGLYGLSLGGMFFGESMFHRRTDASKLAFWILAERLASWEFDAIDCQLPTAHLQSLGAGIVPRRDFLRELKQSLTRETRRGPWGDASE